MHELCTAASHAPCPHPVLTRARDTRAHTTRHTAGLPGVIVNTLCGSLTAYALAGLRYNARSIALNCVVVCVQALISIQLQVFCVWLTPNQVRARVCVCRCREAGTCARNSCTIGVRCR